MAMQTFLQRIKLLFTDGLIPANAAEDTFTGEVLAFLAKAFHECHLLMFQAIEVLVLRMRVTEAISVSGCVYKSYSRKPRHVQTLPPDSSCTCNAGENPVLPRFCHRVLTLKAASGIAAGLNMVAIIWFFSLQLLRSVASAH